MPKKAQFTHKLINKLDKLDRESLQTHLASMAHDRLQLEYILDKIPESIILFDENYKIYFENKQASVFYLNNRQKTASPIYDLFADTQLTQFVKIKSPIPSEKRTADLRLLAPREMSVRVTIEPIEGSNKPRLFLMIISQITTKVQETMTTSPDSILRLASGIAHEIGNPLNSMMIHIELMKKELAKSDLSQSVKLNQHIEVLTMETKRLDKIIKAFLKATRKPPLRYKIENLNKVAEDALRLLEPELQNSGIRVKFNKDANLPDFLFDSERLRQVFINLIKNAKDAMPTGGDLNFSIFHKAQVVLIACKDSGVGIKEEDLPHIFEAYFTTKTEGAGLGLMTVYNTVREHGGKIEVASKINRGTTFTIYLPIRLPKLQISQSKARG